MTIGRSGASSSTGRGRGRRGPVHVLLHVLLHVVPALVGGLALLVAADGLAGVALDRARGIGGPTEGVALADQALPPTTDERAAGPAYAGAPWADRYFAELEALPITYVPFLGPQEREVHGRYINSVGGVRTSYEPAGSDAPDVPEVWFFGGSTLWGEGQRDAHTIPSEVARLAEADGQLLRVRNFGIRGYTAFQEFVSFERELARRPAPDLAVFYHGANELYSLLEAPENLGVQPSIYQLAVFADAFRRAPPLPGGAHPPRPSVFEEYRSTSLLTRVLGGVVPPAAAADDVPYQAAPSQVQRALDAADAIYRRSVALIRHEADRAGAPALVLWQPGPASPTDPYWRLTRQVATVGGGIDISDALADAPGPVYIDGLHTNELGARLVADAVWAQLSPALAAAGVGR